MSVRRKLRNAALATIPTMRHLDMPIRLRHLAGLGFSPKVIFDIGSAQGDWARLANQIWPHAEIVGFEPNASRVPSLDRTRAEVSSFTYHRCFLGAVRREIRYVDHQDQTSLYDQKCVGGTQATSPMMVLDELIEEGKIPRPDFLKLDVQGYELEVLKGARRALAGAQGALLEVSVYHLSPDMPTVLDVLNFMLERGFFWYDLLGMLRRESDDAMAHMDFLFLRDGHPLIRDSWD